MKRIGIAGDSFFAPTQNIPNRLDCKDSAGKHFSELMASQLGYELYPLSRGACSNSVIRLQVSQLVKEKVDFVIYGSTSVNRLEYPNVNKNNNSFIAELGIYNFVYSTHPDLSSLNSNFSENNTHSDTISNILAGYGDCSEEQRQSIRFYFENLFDERYKQIQDSYIMSSGVQELIDNCIPYLCLFDNYVNLIPYFQKKNKRVVTEDYSLLPFRYDSMDEETGEFTKRRYHVSDKNQVVIAERLCNYIKSNNLLVWS